MIVELDLQKSVVYEIVTRNYDIILLSLKAIDERAIDLIPRSLIHPCIDSTSVSILIVTI